jgi:hypothetical protein
MGHVKPFMYPAIPFLIGLGAQVSGYTSPTLAYLLFGSAALLSVIPAWDLFKLVRGGPSSGVLARDVGVGEAIAYIHFREWGRRFWDAAGSPHVNSSIELNSFLEAAVEGAITVWGQTTTGGHYVSIPTSFWRGSAINWASLLRDEPVTETTTPGVASQTNYTGLMTSRAQVQARWPRPKRRFRLRRPWEFVGRN